MAAVDRTTYEQWDYFKAKSLLPTVAATRSASSTNFLGFYEVGERIAPPPTSSADPANPTIFCRWELRYIGDPLLTYDADADPPVREGVISVEARVEPGAYRGLLISLFTLVRQNFRAANGADMLYGVEGRTQIAPQFAGWFSQELLMPFTATGGDTTDFT